MIFFCTCIVGLLDCEVVKRYRKCKVVCLKSIFHEQSAPKMVYIHLANLVENKIMMRMRIERSKKNFLEYRDKSKNFYL